MKPDAQPLTRSATPFDPPNVHLCLREPVTLKTYFGIPLRTRHLDLFVDAPDVFVDTLISLCGSDRR